MHDAFNADVIEILIDVVFIEALGGDHGSVELGAD